MAAGLGDHLIGPVLRVGDDVVTGDTDHRDALIGEVPAERGQSGGDVLHVRAVVTDEGDDEGGTRELVEADRGAGRRLGQCERRRGVPRASMLDSTAMPSRVRSRSSLAEPWLPLPDGCHRCVQNRLSMSCCQLALRTRIRIARVSASRAPATAATLNQSPKAARAASAMARAGGAGSSTS